MAATQKLFIPSKIKVGYQNRGGTYTGKLAYVIYYDAKNVLRKETSWNSWRDKKIEADDFDNTPTTGFVLNKGVGGVRESYGWNTRNEYIRIFDPRGFEFEISVANLLFILQECNCDKGKGLEGEFVYAWDGTELILLPAISKDYKDSMDYTNLQSQKVKARDLVKGTTYITKKLGHLLYLGRFDVYNEEINYNKRYNEDGSYKPVDYNVSTNKHVFLNIKREEYGDKYTLTTSMANLAGIVSSETPANFSTLVDDFQKSKYGSKVASLEVVPYESTELHNGMPFIYNYEPNKYYRCGYHDGTDSWYNKDVIFVSVNATMSIENNIMHVSRTSANSFPTPEHAQAWEKVHSRSSYSYVGAYRGYNYVRPFEITPYITPTKNELVAVLESGSKFIVSSDGEISNSAFGNDTPTAGE